MPRRIGRENIKKVIDALKEGPMKWTELKAKLGIPERTLSRILDYLQYWGLAKKHKEDGRFGRWSWYEHIKTYETREDYEIALKHSEELLFSLDAILAEEVNLWLLLPHPLSDLKGKNLLTEGKELKPFAEEHLKTGYPLMYEELIEFRKALSELRNLKKYDVKWMFNPIKLSSVNTPEPIKQLEKQRLESFRELADCFLVLKLKVKMGEPLKGACQLCPKVHIVESKNLP